jgi:hypothetical protein
MGVFSGPALVTNGLILDISPFSIKNTALSSTNFFTNGAFANGAGIPQEADSNPTNTIIALPNPGDSNYVLQQNGNYTEYQINLGAQLTASTTYVMSGWYAKSSDYNGADTMFHARAFSASGSHNATGTDLGTVLYTKEVNGITWKYCYMTITTPADYSNGFNWYVGYGQPSHAGYRYYTNLKLEKGTFPGLVDLSGNNNHHNFVGAVNFSNGVFALDGSTSGYNRASALSGMTNNCTVVIWYSTTDGQELWVRGNQNNGVYLAASYGNNYYHAGCGSPTNWVDLKQSVNPVTEGYRNGQFHMWEAKGVDFTGWTYFDWFIYPSGWQMAGNVSKILVYNRSLTTTESAQNFQALRGRFGI